MNMTVSDRAAKAPKYTPYVKTPNPFSIGLSAIDPKDWIEPDAELEAFLAEKDRLCRDTFDAVFQATEGSEAAQRECLDMLVDHLLDRHGHIYSREGSVIRFGNRAVDLDVDQPPLLIAGSLIQDDLAILERRETGWHLTAGFVAFPSSWSLREKAGKPMEQVHEHVPGFGAGTRNAIMINRIFDNLQPDLPAVRMNWSIYPQNDLFWPPERSALYRDRPFDPASNFIRVERQSLRRLPKTGGIVFSIRIYTDPVAVLHTLGDDGRTATILAERLEGLSPEQLDYKGMTAKRDRLVAYLRSAAICR